MDSALPRALSGLATAWPDATWTPDGDGDEQTGFYGWIGGRVVFATLMEPDDERVTGGLRWEACIGDDVTLGRTAVEAVRLVLGRVAGG